MDRAKQLHLDHFRSHGDFIDSKKSEEKMPDKHKTFFYVFRSTCCFLSILSRF